MGMTQCSGGLNKMLGRSLGLLARQNAYISCDGLDSVADGADQIKFDLMQRAADGGEKKISDINRATRDELLKQGWVRRHGNELRITRAGVYRLRREQSRSDPCQSQHQERDFENVGHEGRTRTVLRNLDESPLAWLLRRKGKDGKPLLSQAQFDAGERLREDFWFAQMSPQVTANWNGFAPEKLRRRSAPSGSDMTDFVIAAKARVNAALSLVGPELSGVLVDICCHMKGLEATEKSCGWPQRSGKIVLLLALSSLARHYGLENGETTGRKPGKVEHWGASDFRPNLEAWR